MQAMMDDQFDQGADGAELDVRAAEQDMEEAQRAAEEARARQLAAEQEAARAGFWARTFDVVADVSKAAGTINAATGGALASNLLHVNPMMFTVAAGATALAATGASAVKNAEKAGHEYKADLASVDQQKSDQGREVAETDKSRAIDQLASNAESKRSVQEQAKTATEQEHAHQQTLIKNAAGA